jgi:thiol-disulfide isomerase/thioredoxin
MRGKIFLLAAFLFSCLIHLNAQQAPASSDEILKEAYQQAVKENKKVLIMFHASWCGWCHRMDSSLNDKTCKQFFADNFVIRHLVVFESKGKKHLENPGALELLTKYKGHEDGIPYWLIFDKNGELLADSKMRAEGAGLDSEGDNSGCPATKEEVEYFIGVLKKTTSLNREALAIIEKRFRQNEY